MPLTIDVDAVEFITLDELKAHLNKTSDADDTELETFRSAAERHVETIVGPVLWRTVTQTSRGASGVALNLTPVVSVETVDGVAPSASDVDLEAGIVTGLPSSSVSIAYTAGRTECPDDIRLAALIIAKHLWETQRGNAGSVRSALPGGESEPQAAGSYLIPYRAASLLKPHMLATGFA